MSDKTQAVHDLIWLSERLRGVISIKDELISYDALQNQLAELTKSVEQSKEELKSLLEKKKLAKKDITDLLNQNAAIAADYKSRGDKLIQDSKLTADDLLQKLKSEVSDKHIQAEAKLNDTKNAIVEAIEQLKDVKHQINQHTNKRDSILKELDAVKNRI